jgi:hypothetical protein
MTGWRRPFTYSGTPSPTKSHGPRAVSNQSLPDSGSFRRTNMDFIIYISFLGIGIAALLLFVDDPYKR